MRKITEDKDLQAAFEAAVVVWGYSVNQGNWIQALSYQYGMNKFVTQAKYPERKWGELFKRIVPKFTKYSYDDYEVLFQTAHSKMGLR